MRKPFNELESLALEQLIRYHRDRYSLRLATAAEIEGLSKPIDPAFPPVMTLNPWWLVAFETHGSPSNQCSFHAIAENRTTSGVQLIDLSSSRICTRHSIYEIGELSHEPPTLPALIWLCAFITRTGLGAKLGVPEVWT